MMIQSNEISLALKDTDAMKRIRVSVPNTKDGEISHVAMGVTMDGPVQKETGNGTSVYTEADAKQLNIEGVLPSDGAKMSPADFISQCMTGEDAQALLEEETPLEEYTSSQLERALHRVKEQRREHSEAVEQQAEQEREEQREMEEAAAQSIAEQQVSSRVKEQMQQSGLPATTENAIRLSHAMKMTAEIGSFSSAAMKFFVAQNFSITPEHIQASVAGGQAMGDEFGNAVEESGFEDIEQQVKEMLSKDGNEVDEVSMETAKWLYDNHLPVTGETVQTCRQMKELKEVGEEVLCARIADNMADGVPAEKANLLKFSVAEALTKKRQLEEIRLTMSVEAIRNMSAKGIPMDISRLENLVEELREQEQQARQALMEELQISGMEEQEDLLNDTIQAAKHVLDAPAPFFGKVMQDSEKESLQTLSSKAIVYTEEFSKIQHHYESVGTEVRRDLGDSMRKAFQNVDDILEDLSLEITWQNQRAVRSLAYNQMALTEENIVRMKEYDSRVTSLMKDLQPPVVAELIKRNINPLELTLDELSDRVHEIQSEIGQDDISFSKYLWKLDHQKAVSPEERQTMIGIYRLLDKIEKSDGAVVGQLMKEGRELSFESLLSAVRSRQKAGMDVQIDDEFGGLENLVESGTSISDQIQAAYQQNLVKQLRKEISPSVLQNLQEEDLSLEQLLELCRQEDTQEADYYEEMAQNYREIMSAHQERIQQFLSALELPDTIANIHCVQEYLKQGSREIKNMWEPEQSEEILDALDEPDKLDGVLESVEEKQKKRLLELGEKDDIKYEDLRNISRMNQRISFYGSLRKYQMYEIPIFTEQGITTCNVTIQSQGNDKKGMVEIAMESPEFGKLQASFRVSGNHVKGFVTIANGEQVGTCQRRMEQLEKDLEEKGYTMDRSNLIAGKRDSLPLGDKAEGAKNKDLYRIAKTFIVVMSRKDEVV